MIQRTKGLYKKLRQQRAGSLKRLIKLTNLWQHSLKKREKGLKQQYKSEIGYHKNTKDPIIYYETLHDTKFNNVYEGGQFLEIYNLPGLNQEELENAIRHTNSEETERTFRNFPKS